MDEKLKELTEKLTQRDKALRDSEKKLKFLIDSIPEFIVETDLNGIRLFVSAPVEKALGYPPEYYLGRSCFEEMHPDDIEINLKKLEKGIQNKTTEIAYYRYLTKDKKYITIEATCTPIYDSVEKLVGILTVNRVVPKRELCELNILDKGENK